jgi:hypothetical protein
METKSTSESLEKRTGLISRVGSAFRLAKSKLNGFSMFHKDDLIILGNLDSPAIDERLAGNHHPFHGWLFLSDGRAVDRVEVHSGKVCLTQLQYGCRREDVYSAYPQYREALRSGFFGTVLLPKDLTKPLFLVIWDAGGNQVRLPVSELRPRFLADQPPISKPENEPEAPDVKILVVGLAKSGTTALFFKIRNSLPYGIKTLFEPISYSEKDAGSSRCVLAKIILSLGVPIFGLDGRHLKHRVRYEDFMVFDKKILIVRDPRDRLISQVLYSAKKHSFTNDPGKRERFLELLRKKERDPGSVSLLEVLRLGSQLRSLDWTPERWRAAFLKFFDFGIKFHDSHPDFFVVKYEEFIDGKIADLEKFLGFELTGEARVDIEYERVVRTKSQGDWKNWFLKEDIDFFRPIFASYMERYGYRDDWTLSPHPVILPIHASGFVERVPGDPPPS